MSCSAEKEAALLAEGWKKQFMAGEPRLIEAVEAYRDLGFEVHLEAVDPQACADSEGCTSCFEVPEVADQFKIIFTRRSDKANNEDLS